MPMISDACPFAIPPYMTLVPVGEYLQQQQTIELLQQRLFELSGQASNASSSSAWSMVQYGDLAATPGLASLSATRASAQAQTATAFQDAVVTEQVMPVEQDLRFNMVAKTPGKRLPKSIRRPIMRKIMLPRQSKLSKEAKWYASSCWLQGLIKQSVPMLLRQSKLSRKAEWHASRCWPQNLIKQSVPMLPRQFKLSREAEHYVSICWLQGLQSVPMLPRQSKLSIKAKRCVSWWLQGHVRQSFPMLP